MGVGGLRKNLPQGAKIHREIYTDAYPMITCSQELAGQILLNV
jgi:hypothetical protein